MKQREQELAQTSVMALERAKGIDTHKLNQDILAEQLMFEQSYVVPSAYQQYHPQGALDASEYQEREWRETIAGWEEQQNQRAALHQRTAPSVGFRLDPSGSLQLSTAKERKDKTGSKKSYASARDAAPSEQEERRRDRNRGVCRILIDVEYKHHKEAYQVKMHETLPTHQLYERVKEFLEKNFEYDEEKEPAFSIHYRNQALSPSESLMQ